jgi:hypothetical protein
VWRGGRSAKLLRFNAGQDFVRAGPLIGGLREIRENYLRRTSARHLPSGLTATFRRDNSLACRRSRRVGRVPILHRTTPLPAETRLWAALQHASGGPWGGCVYDTDAILQSLGRSPLQNELS